MNDILSNVLSLISIFAVAYIVNVLFYKKIVQNKVIKDEKSCGFHLEALDQLANKYGLKAGLMDTLRPSDMEKTEANIRGKQIIDELHFKLKTYNVSLSDKESTIILGTCISYSKTGLNVYKIRLNKI